MTDLVRATPTSDEVPLARRINVWLAKFASLESRKAYADDLGFPHDLREWSTARPAGAPGRTGRPRGQLRRGVAFFSWCADQGLDPLGGVGLEQIQQWLDAIAAAGLAKRTRDRMLTSVSAFYVAMQRQGLPVGNPAGLVDRRTAGLSGTGDDDDQLYLDLDQTRQLLILARAGTGRGQDLYRERNLVVIELLAVTGARAAEITGLTLSDYRRPGPGRPAELALRGKGAKRRRATVEPTVADDIDAWIRVRADLLGTHLPTPAGHTGAGTQLLLCTRTGRALSPGYLGVILRAVAGREGSPLRGIAGALHPHALRAAFATTALDAGVPIDQVKDALGHSEISTTLRYDRRRGRRNTRAFDVVSGLLSTAESESLAPEDAVAAALAAVDEQQIPGQTSIPLTGR